MDGSQPASTPHTIACDLLDQATRVLQKHDPRSQTAHAAAEVLSCAARAVSRQPGEHREDPDALWTMADTLRALVQADPLNAERPARRLRELVATAQHLEDPSRWRPSAAQRERAYQVLGTRQVPHHRFTADGRYQARVIYSDEWTDIPLSLLDDGASSGALERAQPKLNAAQSPEVV